MEYQEQAIIDWLRTFEIPPTQPCGVLGDLSDGNVLSSVLTQIAPSYFEANTIDENSRGDSTVAITNIKRIIRSLDGYYRYVLRKFVDTSSIDMNAIVIDRDHKEILALAELVLGAAVMCDDISARGIFIQQIFSLDHTSQTYLKELIQSVISNAQDIEGEEEETGPEESQALEEAVIRSEETIAQLRTEQQKLIQIISDLEQDNKVLHNEKQKMQNTISELQFERVNSPRKDAQDSKAALKEIQSSLDDAKREAYQKNIDLEALRKDMVIVKQRLNESIETIDKLKKKNADLTEELDVASSNGMKLVAAEDAIRKYQEKLEEMMNTKKMNKELSNKIEECLGQVESSRRATEIAERSLEQQREKSVKLERENYELKSSLEIIQIDVTSLKSENSNLSELNDRRERELRSLRLELSQAQTVPSYAVAAPSLSDELELSDNLNSLKEKVKKLESELSVLRSSASSGADSSSEMSALAKEVEELKQVKKEKEEKILSLRRTLADTQTELHKANLLSPSDSDSQMNEIRLARSHDTIRLLEDKLKEQAASILRLEGDKSKLEAYSRRTLTWFNDLIKGQYSTLQAEKKASDDEVKFLQEKLAANRETSKREEKLMLSALYELGRKVMDNTLQTQMPQPGAVQSSVAEGGIASNGNGKALFTPKR